MCNESVCTISNQCFLIKCDAEWYYLTKCAFPTNLCIFENYGKTSTFLNFLQFCTKSTNERCRFVLWRESSTNSLCAYTDCKWRQMQLRWHSVSKVCTLKLIVTQNVDFARPNTQHIFHYFRFCCSSKILLF